MKNSNPFQGWFLFFCGICMGVADLVPGFSGGTLAFIFGFYEPLLSSLQTFNRAAFSELFTKGWIAFCDKIAWRFLATLLSGVICAIICFAKLFHMILSHELYRTYLFALFFGFVFASFVIYIRQVKKWNFKLFFGFMCGVILGFLLSGSSWGQSTSLQFEGPLYFMWLGLCGALAVSALLLPGISGSYVLTLLGVYPSVIAALVEFVDGLQRGEFHSFAFTSLFSLGVGVALGGVCFAKLLSTCLHRYPHLSLATLCGFMIGAIRSVWPFWVYEALPSKISKGIQLIPIEPYFPSFDLFFWLVASCSVLGFCVVYSIDSIKRASLKKTEMSQNFNEMGS